MRHRVCPGANAAAGDLVDYIEAVRRLRNLQRPAHFLLMRHSRKHGHVWPAIDFYLAGTWIEADPGHSGFPPSRAVVILAGRCLRGFLCHPSTPRPFRE